MFGTDHSKLKSNLKLAIQRLKLLEKKKTENARKFTKEIAEFIQINKYDRAKIKVEHIIREDYMVEGMEIVEMYCDLLLARFGLLESMKELDLGLYECVASLIWVAPRLESECVELRIIADELQKKYGKEFATMCRTNKSGKVNERLMLKMSEQAPGELLVEKYLVEIAKSHNVAYKPNPEIAVRDPNFFYNSISHIEKNASANNNNNNNNNNNSNNSTGGAGNNGGGGGGNGGGFSSPTNSSPTKAIYPSSQQVSYIGFNKPQTNAVSNQSKKQENQKDFSFPVVPDSLPTTYPKVNDQTDNFDDLTARFENLKKK